MHHTDTTQIQRRNNPLALPDCTDDAILIDDGDSVASWSLSADVLRGVGIGDDGDEALASLYPCGVVVGRLSRA